MQCESLPQNDRQKMNQGIFFRPVIGFLAPLICGIAMGAWFDGFIPWVMAAVVLSTAHMLRAIAAKRNLVFAPLIFFFSLGYLTVQPWISPSIPDQHISHYAKPVRWTIVGTVCNDPIVSQKGHIRFVLNVESIQSGNNSFPATGRIRVTCRGEISPEFRPGDRIKFPGKIRTFRNFQNPGGFDFERYMAFRTILATTYVTSDNVTFLETYDAQNVKHWVSNARRKVTGIIDDTQMNHASAAIMKALVIGMRDGIDKPLREAFNKSGTGHLLAISGLHVGIVASFFFLAFSRFFSMSRTFLDHAWVGKGSALLCIIPVTIYGLLAGMSPSTQRAVLMINVFLMTFFIKREQDSINTLAIAAMVILIIHPPALFSISFQLSFTAVFAILFGFSMLWKNQNRLDTNHWIRKKLSAFFFASLFAILGSLPLVMYYFNQTSLVGLAANFILVPLIGFIVVPLGLISALVSPISLGLSSVGFQAGGAVLSFALSIVHFFSSLPFSSIKTVTPSMLEIALYYLSGMSIFCLISRHRSTVHQRKTLQFQAPFKDDTPEKESKNIDPPQSTSSMLSRSLPERLSFFSWYFRQKAPVYIISILLLIGAADLSYWIYIRFFQQDLRITILDVGQGNAAVIEFPGGKTMLIDGGGFYDTNSFDVGERITAPLLWRKKIKTVDTLMLTHPDSDHLNGLLYISRHFNVKTIRTNHEPADTLGYQQLQNIILEKEIHTPPFTEAHRSFEIGGVQVRILYPPEDFLEKKERESWRDHNANSMVIQLKLGEFSCLFTGDIRARSETELISLIGDDLKSRILIAPHHGSKTSSTPKFIDSVDPEAVIFCAGWDNRFKLPNEQVVNRFQQRDIKIFRTDHNGAIQIHTNGVSTKITPFLK
jgi:competence protein ComEC